MRGHPAWGLIAMGAGLYVGHAIQGLPWHVIAACVAYGIACTNILPEGPR